MAEPKIDGVTCTGKKVAAGAPGALYQLVDGDPSNEQFLKVLTDGAKQEQEAIRRGGYQR